MDKYMLNVEINTMIFRVIGLELDREYNIVDQDNGCQLRLNGKFLKYYFGNDPSILDINDRVLDVVRDSFTMNFLLSYYIEKLQLEDPDLYIYSYNPYIDKRTDTSRLEIKGMYNDNPFRYYTDYYINDSFKFIEMLYYLNGENVKDILHEYDKLLIKYEEEEIKAIKKAEREAKRLAKQPIIRKAITYEV